jgi:hypothetical protein
MNKLLSLLAVFTAAYSECTCIGETIKGLLEVLEPLFYSKKWHCGGA